MILGEIYISPFSSLTFDTAPPTFMEDVKYLQKFAVNESGMKLRFTSNRNLDFRILVHNSKYELISDTTEVFTHIDLYSYLINIPILTEVGVYKIELQILFEGVWFSFLTTCVECISEDEAEDTTILFEAWDKKDNWCIKFYSENQRAKWRISGGLLIHEFESLASQNTFRDQRIRLHQLSQKPYLQKVITLGDTLGVPVWACEKLNFFLSLSNVYIRSRNEMSKTRIVRVEGETPSMILIDRYYPLFVIKCKIEEQIEYEKINN